MFPNANVLLLNFKISLCCINSFLLYPSRDWCSHLASVRHGVSQGSILGPFGFLLCLLPFGLFLQRLRLPFHFEVDGTQIYISLSPFNRYRVYYAKRPQHHHLMTFLQFPKY